MVTKDDCVNAGYRDTFRYLAGTYSRSKDLKQVRVSGKCKTWKTRPDDFQLPVKYGMYESLYITPSNAAMFITEAEYEARKESAQAVGSVLKNPSSGIRIVHNKLLGGWYIVRGPHQTPIGGRFDSKADAQAHISNHAVSLIRQRGTRQNPSEILGGKSIETKFIPASNVKGARIRASVLDGDKIQRSIYVSFDYGGDEYSRHLNAALAMRDKMGWTGDLIGVGTRGGYTFGFRDMARAKRNPARPDAFEVIVGNIGSVYSGNNYMKARAKFATYVKQSKSNLGRAGREPVTLMHNGEIKSEYAGTLENPRSILHAQRPARKRASFASMQANLKFGTLAGFVSKAEAMKYATAYARLHRKTVGVEKKGILWITRHVTAAEKARA
jgi:hypothetical protein